MKHEQTLLKVKGNFSRPVEVILLLLATSPEKLPSHLAAMDSELLRDPLILGAVNACADFLSALIFEDTTSQLPKIT
jgi:hypothetical protein